MGILNYITQACDNLAATTSPTIDALGLHMVLCLATIMLVWFGVQEALASASGGPGFSMGAFLNYFMLATWTYSFVTFYDSTIPGIGYSLTGFVNGGAQYLVSVIGVDSLTQIQTALTNAAAGWPTWHYHLDRRPLLRRRSSDHHRNPGGVLSACVTFIVAYGAVALTVVKIIGPVLIPFLVFSRTEFLFWGWLRAFIGFCFYKVVAAAVLSIVGNLLTNYYTTLASFTDPGTMVKTVAPSDRPDGGRGAPSSAHSALNNGTLLGEHRRPRLWHRFGCFTVLQNITNTAPNSRTKGELKCQFCKSRRPPR